MNLPDSPFQLINWDSIPKEPHAGETGMAWWQTTHLGNIRIRKVHYEAGYLADHWCEKGHIIFCTSGSMTTELANGNTVTLTQGMTYTVGDGSMAHRTRTVTGCELFIVD